eukprot:12083015-Alexandrium_andersonii.AAC.1
MAMITTTTSHFEHVGNKQVNCMTNANARRVKGNGCSSCDCAAMLPPGGMRARGPPPYGDQEPPKAPGPPGA